jgi:hypothetical protein
VIYIRYPHPDLETDTQYLDWKRRAQAGEAPDWRELFDWLARHSWIAWKGLVDDAAGQAKCWYSEAPIIGKHVKDVEHFRPKSEAAPLTKSQRAKLMRMGLDIPERRIQDPGYDWLKYDSSNYRLSHPQVNRTGGKGSVFPILDGTTRISSIDDPSKTKEYAILLDPSNPEDARLLIVLADGEIVPSHKAEQLPIGVSVDELWESDGMRHRRAYASIVVYQLDDQEFTRARREKYNEMQEDIAVFDKAMDSGELDWKKSQAKAILKKLSCLSPFALASRCAMRDHIAQLESRPEKQGIRTELQRMLEVIEKKEK